MQHRSVSAALRQWFSGSAFGLRAGPFFWTAVRRQSCRANRRKPTVRLPERKNSRTHCERPSPVAPPCRPFFPAVGFSAPICSCHSLKHYQLCFYAARRFPPRPRLDPERVLRTRPEGFLPTIFRPREFPREVPVAVRLEREFRLERELREEVPRAERLWLGVPRAVVRRDLCPRDEEVLRVAVLPALREREEPVLRAGRLPREPELERRDAEPREPARRGVTRISISSISTSSSIYESSADAADCELLVCDRFPRDEELRDERPPLRPLSSAVSRLTSLLKLLCCPRAVWSCTSSARLLSSNF